MSSEYFVIISPQFFFIACPIVAVIIIWAVRRVVKRANTRTSLARSQTERVQVRVQVAENTAVIAREQHANIVATASEAMQQTGQAMQQTSQALHVSRVINEVHTEVAAMKVQMNAIGGQVNTVGGQVNALIGYIADELSALPKGRHAGPPVVHHELPAPAKPEADQEPPEAAAADTLTPPLTPPQLPVIEMISPE